MKNRHYVLVIVDSSGGATRRVCVRRRSLQILAGTVAVLVLASLGFVLHAALRHGVAVQARSMARQNAHLSTVVTELEERLPAARLAALRAELSFAQLWTKSGLGVEAKLLGMGPAEPQSAADGFAAMGPMPEEPIEVLPPLAVRREFCRIEAAARALQGTLAETLEYFHDAERLLSNTPSLRPAKTPWITSSFGRRRHPISGYWVMHKGMDLGGYVGMEVIAPADGVVIWTGRRGGYGKTIVIDHGYGLQTHYAHLHRVAAQTGHRIKRGDPIAEMGNTGLSTGPHLHYEVRRNGRPLDPGRFILD